MSHSARDPLHFRPRAAVAEVPVHVPRAVPPRLAVCISGSDARGRAFCEHTSVELAAPDEVLFCSALPLEVGDELQIGDLEGALAVRASVVFARYYNGKTAVAARLAEPDRAFPIRKR